MCLLGMRSAPFLIVRAGRAFRAKSCQWATRAAFPALGSTPQTCTFSPATANKGVFPSRHIWFPCSLLVCSCRAAFAAHSCPIFRNHPLSISSASDSPRPPRAELCGANLDRARASLPRAGYPEQHLSGVCSLLPRGARYPARVSSFVFVPTIFAPYPWNNITNASHIHDKTEQCRR